jgi:hypothetical protein
MKTSRCFLILSLFAAAATALLLAPAASAQPYDAWATFTASPSGYIRIPDSDSLDPTSQITIEGWFYLDSISTTAEDCRSLVGKNFSTDYWVGVCNSGSPLVPQLRSYLHGGGSAMTGGRMYIGRWNHFAVTWDGTTRRHYINGDLMLERPDAGPRVANSSELRLGSDVSWEHTPNGGLDEVRIWSVARSAAQLRSTINVPIVSPEPGLVSVWNMEYPSPLTDPISGNNGVIVGDVRYSGYSAMHSCTTGSTTHCFGNRYQVSVEWRLSDGTTGMGTVVPGYSSDSGLFWFFSASNWELLVKALNGCPVNGKRWIFSAATTNVGYTLIVFDEETGLVKRYINPVGVNAPAVNDTAAFACP